MASVKSTRKFVCQIISPEGYPAKDRSGKLGVFEELDLSKFFEKIKGQSSTDNISKTIKQIEELTKSVGK